MVRTYHDLTQAHFIEYQCEEMPLRDTFVGFAVREAGRLVAIAAAYADGPDWWVAYSSKDWNAPSVHRQVRRSLEALASAGVREVWAYCDERRPNARKWMERLRFQPVNETDWRLDLGLHLRRSRVRDAGRRNQEAGET